MQKDCHLGCCNLISAWIHQVILNNISELKSLLSISGPLVLTYLLDVAPILITTVFCGRLGKSELDAFALGNSIVILAGQSIGLGICSACDTFFSQIYGGKNLKLIGVVLQRGILILSLSCFPCWAFFVNTKNILLLLGQDPTVAGLAELYVLTCIPALAGINFFNLEIRYLQNQGIIWPQVVASVLACIINGVLNYVLLFVLKIGVIGAAIAVTVSIIAKAILLFFYIWIRKIYVDTWPGWTIECLKDWGSYFALALPTMIMLSLKWWTFEIAIILSGLINLVELGGQSIMHQMMNLLNKISLALSLASCIRVGTFLGAGETEQAKKSARLSFVIAAFPVFLGVGLLIGLRHEIASIFTNDSSLLSLVSDIMPLCAVFQIVGSACNLFYGILRGIGMQKVGAFVTVGGYVLIVFPMAVPLMFSAKLGVKGFWTGINVGLAVMDIAFVIYLWNANWKLITEKALERVGLKQLNEKNPTALAANGITSSEHFELNHYNTMNSGFIAKQDHEELCKQEENKSMKKLIVRRVFEALAIVSVLGIGLIIRFTLKDH
ncbi:multidrug and toxin extrusion protein 2 isoform X1 [Xenopus laevis]|uniref:Multidrug and toxin extrusion protein n=1 Tax=Xenopus laevis TaxID=8355 RepID=A0A8J0UNL4_XENLA|nr:multidrug and toxin extrusion protein 2 isoform X1 [Xenopus laevis]